MLARLAIGLTLMFLLPILAIHTRPYDGRVIRALLLPPAGCAAPCFRGLRPGYTTLSEAMAYFQGRPEIYFFVERSSPVQDTALLNWRDTWTGYSGALHFIDGRLVELTLSGLHLDQIWLALGEPNGTQMADEMIYIDEQRFILRPTVNIGFYTANEFRLNFASACPDFWDQSAYITMGQAVVPEKLNNAVSLGEQRQIVCEKERALRRAGLGG